MIQKLIYDKLRLDEVDENSSEALSEIQEAFPDIQNLDGLEYTYKSLKTILGDNSADWAKRKIIYEQYSRPQDAMISQQAELPIIGIYLAGPLVKQGTNSNRDYEGELKIDCRTAVEDISTGLVRQIAFRVKRILEPKRNNELDQLWAHCNLPCNYSISQFRLNSRRLDPYLGDIITIVYQVRVSFI